jgi:hypothetical protein
MPQNPTRRVHALLAGFVQDSLIENQSRRHKCFDELDNQLKPTDKIIARTLFFHKSQKSDLCFDRLNQHSTTTKQARTQILENVTNNNDALELK